MNGKVALVTGGATGIGLTTVRRLLSAGACVMLASRDEQRGQRVVAELSPGRAAFHPADVSDEASVVSLVASTIQRFGHLDYLFNNAGVEGTVGPMAAWSADVVDAVLAVNVKGAFLCMKHAASQMHPDSVIVNCSSLLATIPMPLAAPYAASKAAMLSLTRSAAAELAERGLRPGRLSRGGGYPDDGPCVGFRRRTQGRSRSRGVSEPPAHLTGEGRGGCHRPLRRSLLLPNRIGNLDRPGSAGRVRPDA